MTSAQTEVMIAITARAAKLASIAVVTRPYIIKHAPVCALHIADISLHVSPRHRE